MANQVPSFGELVELVHKAFPDIQEYEEARSFLAGSFYAVIADEGLIRVANSLRNYTGVREDKELESQMANVVSLSPNIIKAMKQTIEKESNNNA